MVTSCPHRSDVYADRLPEIVWLGLGSRGRRKQALCKKAMRNLTDLEEPQFAAGATAALLDDRAGQPALVCVDSLVKHLEYAPPAYTKDGELKGEA